MKYLLIHLKKYKKESIMAPLFKMLEASFDLFVPIVVAKIIDVGIAGHDTAYIIRCVLLMILLAVVGTCCSFTAQFFAAKAAVGCATGLRHDLFAHIQELGAAEVDRIGTSTLITRMTSDINQVQSVLNMFLRLFLRSPFIVFGAAIMAFTIHVKMALIFVAAIPILAVIVFTIMLGTAPGYKKIQGKLDGITRMTRENLTGVRVVRAFGREAEETEHFENANEDLVSYQNRIARISALMNPLTYCVVNISIIAILYFGSRFIAGGTFFSGGIVAMVNYMSQILTEMVKMAMVIISMSKAFASLSRIESVLDTTVSMTFPTESGAGAGPISGKSESGETSGDTESGAGAGTSDTAVCFEHVSLSYAGAGDESLTDVSFAAKKGQTIGIIGGTGSGKTTLVSLIPRFYDATKGLVTINGIPISQWGREELRTEVGIVQQKAQLFKGTIRSNLLWGDQNASEEDLWNALDLAQAASFVKEKEQGLDEAVEQGGRNLSGGQRQRLAIARALVRKPKILILDDSASALDFATDAALRKALKTLPFDVTTFIVSQRTSSLQHADQIIVLDDGMMVGLGTHEELLASCEIYREIYESQFRKGGASA